MEFIDYRIKILKNFISFSFYLLHIIVHIFILLLHKNLKISSNLIKVSLNSSLLSFISHLILIYPAFQYIVYSFLFPLTVNLAKVFFPPCLRSISTYKKVYRLLSGYYINYQFSGSSRLYSLR